MVARVAGEAGALVDEAASDAEAARRRVDEQHAQLGDALALAILLHEDAADVLAAPLGDPAALVRGVELLDVVGDDAGDERLEARVPAVLARVQLAVALDDPAVVAGVRRTEDVGRLAVGVGRFAIAEQAADRDIASRSRALVRLVERVEQARDVVAREAVEGAEGFPAVGGEGDVAVPGVVRRARAADESAPLEPLQEAAEVSRIERRARRRSPSPSVRRDSPARTGRALR